MTRALALALALLLLAATNAVAEDCTLKRMGTLDMVGAHDERIVVPVTIDGQPFKFLLDTGGVYSEIGEAAANALGLSKASIAAEIYTMNGKRLRTAAFVSSLDIGGNYARNLHLLVSSDLDEGIDGVLAPDILQVFDVDLDFANGKVNLFSPDHCKGSVVYWSMTFTDVPFTMGDGFHIDFGTTLDGQELDSILDTGSSVTFLSAKWAYRLFSIDTSSPSPDMEKADFAIANLPVYRRRFQTLAVSGIAVQNPMIYLQPDADEAAFRLAHDDKERLDPVYGSELRSTPVILGMNILTKLHVYIAYKEHELYVTAVDAH